MNRKIWLSAAVGVSALAFWFFRPVPSEKKVLTKDQVLNILQDLLKKLKNCSIKIAQMSNSVKVNSVRLSRDKLKEILLNDFSVKTLISAEKQEVYQHWETTEDELNLFVNEFCMDDSLIMKYFWSIPQILENAFDGFVLDEQSSLPLALSTHGLSEVLPEVFHCELHLAKIKLQMMMKKDEGIEDWEVEAEVFDLGVECKRKVFQRFGFEVAKKDVNNVIRQGIQNFSSIDQKFKSFVRGLEDIYNEHLDLIMSRQEDKAFEDYIEKKFNNYLKTND